VEQFNGSTGVLHDGCFWRLHHHHARPAELDPTITFNVRSVVAGTVFYDALGNHDVDGETNGAAITIRRR
jgi:hypothetical protein